MVLSPTEKLKRFLTLEIKRGYDNRGVVGGLDKFQPNWQKEAVTAGIPFELVERVNTFLTNYSAKDVEQRKKEIGEILPLLPEPTAKPQRKEPRPRKDLPKEGQLENRRNPQQTRRRGENTPVNKIKPEERAEASTISAPKESAIPAAVIHAAVVQEQPQTATASPAQSDPLAQEPCAVVQRASIQKEPPMPSNAEERKVFKPRPISKNDPSIDESVSNIPGIGFLNSKALAKQEVYTVRDFLYYFPNRYDDYSSFKPINRLLPGEIVTVIGVVRSIGNVTKGKLLVTECVISDGTGRVNLSWFNRSWLTHQIQVGQSIVVSGKVDLFLGNPVFSSLEWEMTDQENILTKRIVPVYALNQNLKQNFLRRILFNTIKHWAAYLPEFMPDSVMESADLLPLQIAIRNIHFPESQEALQRARERLAFDEVFLMQLCVLSQKREWTANTADRFSVEESRLIGWIRSNPFEPTDSQWLAIRDVQHDLDSGHPMNRLIQGDVGSGKTLIAQIAALIVTQGDGQAVIMAPTGVLAEQHYRGFLKLLEWIGQDKLCFRPDQVELLTGSTPDSKKREIRERLENGDIRIIIGTHALIEGPIVYHRLALAVIDEQHRFGVEQRAALRSKGANPHLMVMTATPIPRSLSLTIYGDLDLTVIGELPKGRIPVETLIYTPCTRESVYKLIDREVDQGNQAFIIYPLVEGDGDEEKETRAAVEGAERLQAEIFKDRRIALLHGRMKGDEKDTILSDFRDGKYDILVSTSVIEVGVDIPNATVIMIEGANHFGLAQLHQFRGRVGRGNKKSWCVLIPEKESAVENERLKAMVETNDGFKLAELDLQMRGPGDFIGKRQSGIRMPKIAAMTDVRLIDKARREAEKLFETDSLLTAPENQELKKRVVMAAASEEKGEIS